MKRALVFLSIVLVVAIIGFVVADEEPDPSEKYELTENAYNVHTNVGIVNFSKGTLVGGNVATNFIYLTMPTNFSTPFGNYTFPNETQIDCDVPPGYPDPCSHSGFN